MATNVDTAYLVFTPDPRVYKKIIDHEHTPVWIKFGDTDNIENTRLSGYNTYNPCFYALTIDAEEQKEEPKLGKFLEQTFFENKKGYTKVTIENRDLNAGKTEWYRVDSDAYNKVIGLFKSIHQETFPEEKEEELGVKGSDDTVWGKVVKYKNTTRQKVAEAFKTLQV